jgi:release factor glutamine methyltransferase
MDMRTARLGLRRSLTPLYGEREAAAIAELTMAHVTGLPRMDRLLREQDELSTTQAQEYERCASELSRWRPVQYVIGEAWFDGLRFRVDERVLIPRPETEELVEWIAESIGHSRKHILDIGTGSGCIAVALKRRCAACIVTAVDKSAAALTLARENAAALKAEVEFRTVDILDRSAWPSLPTGDVIVSNPPYVAGGESTSMRPNVLQYEPETAVFVAGEDPLLFYRVIAEFAQTHLLPGGILFFEIHAHRGEEVCRLLSGAGFEDIHLRKDMQGMDRMIMCRKPTKA